jgi:16S rRNA (guanine527-N7)-methyltransferase
MRQVLQAYFPQLNEAQIVQFEALPALYARWNAQINVISRKDEVNIFERHILHSLAIATVIDFKPGTRVLDLGTGGGFPLIPLAIAFPETTFVGSDGILKKIKVVQEIAQAVGLTNTTAYAVRAESLPRASFDFVVCRAVTDICKLLVWADMLVQPGHNHPLSNGLLALKGGDLTDELALLKKRPFKVIPVIEKLPFPFFEWKFLIHAPVSGFAQPYI